ncbi:MAG: metallophosphoesterase [Bacilli bacterium]|nr:metallophosphoesterase [Bacilli bacterium]
MIWLTGDKHGDFNSIYWFCEDHAAAMTKDDYIIILGDFGGIWNYKGETKEEIDTLNKLENLPCSILFIDGNHENFARLNAFPVEEWNGGKVHKIRPHVIHLMRGQVFNLQGRTFATFGGAPSHDIQHGILNPEEYEDDAAFRQAEIDLINAHGGYQFAMYRVKNRTWWEEEVPSQSEWAEAYDNFQKVGYVDFFLTHECGSSETYFVSPFSATKMSKDLEKLMMCFICEDHYFGHYHMDKDISPVSHCLYHDIRRVV